MTDPTRHAGKPAERILAEHAATFPVDRVPDGVLSYTADLFLDTVGCIYGGSGAEGVDQVLATVSRWDRSQQATVLARGKKASAPTAVLANAVMAHARDYDDTHDDAVLHGCVTAVPALMAAGEVRGKPTTGREFLAALAVGLDVSNRISLSLIPYLHVGWLPTTLFGTFGAACAVGRLFELDAAAMRNAMGFAYAQVGGNRQALIDGTLAKRMQPAFGAVAAFHAASFAAASLTAASGFVTGDYGLPVLYTAGRMDAPRLTDELGSRWETANISIKPYPTCRCSHPVIDAALELRGELEDPLRQIERGTISLPPTSMGQIGYPFVLRENPTVDAQFSAQYTAALALVSGRPRLRDFEPPVIRENHDVLALAERLQPEALATESTALTPVHLRVRLRDGSEREARICMASGHPDNPLRPEQLEEKLRDNLSYAAHPPDSARRSRITQALRKVAEADDMAALIGNV